MGKFKFEGFFKNFSSWLNELQLSVSKSKDLLFTTQFPQFDKRKYIILTALVAYIKNNLTTFNKKQLIAEVKNILLIAFESMEHWQELKDLKVRVSKFYRNLLLLKDSQVKNLQVLLDDIHFDLFIFENTHLRMHIHYDFFVRDLLQVFNKASMDEQSEKSVPIIKDLIASANNDNISAQEKFIILRSRILSEFSSVNENADALNNNNVSSSLSDCKSSFFNSSPSLWKDLQDLAKKYEPMSEYIKEQGCVNNL